MNEGKADVENGDAEISLFVVYNKITKKFVLHASAEFY
jgi:hypothetical protein